MSKQQSSPEKLRVATFSWFVLATIAAAAAFTAQPVDAAEELIILAFHDGSSVVLDAVTEAATNGDRVVVIPSKKESDTKVFYSSERAGHPEEGFDSTCAGVDFSEATWYGTMATIRVGKKKFQRIVYRMGATAIAHGRADISASTVQHGYFRYLGESESQWADAGVLVSATAGNEDAVVCVAKATF